MPEGNWPIDSSMPSSDDELLAPLKVGNYRLLRRLGDGGMGIVYEAVQERPERHVALKLMRQAVMTREQLHRFERESELLGGLVHPNIAQVYEAGTHKEGSLSIPFYAMELVPNAFSVTAYAKQANLNRRQRVELMVQICAAIQFAHEHAVLHRDLKPGNILVSPKGIPKVIDLGVSRLLSEASITLTRSDQLIGTIQYMAPEQVSETSSIPSVQWDVYSLGVVLYELVVGQLPYQLPTDNAIRAARVLESAIPTRPKRLDPSISKDLESVIMKALAREPAQRYASVRALADDLQNVLDAKPVRARSSTGMAAALQAIQLTVRRHRKLVIVVFIIGYFLTCLGIRSTRLLQPIDSRWPAFALGQMPYIPDRPLEQVRIVAIENDLTAVAQQLGLTGYDPTIRQSIRPIFGAIVEKIARGKPRAIALDVTYAAASPYDAPFLDSLRKVEESGVPIVACADEWKHRGGPGVLPELPQRHRVGVPGISILNDDVNGAVSMLIDEFSGDEPGFVTQVIAAGLGFPRDAKLYLDLKGRVRVKADGDPTLMRISVLQGGPEREGGIPRGFAANFVQAPSEDALTASSTSVDDLLTLDDDALQRAFAGRVVVIGDSRPDRDILVKVAPGREVRGYQLNAIAIDQGLSDKVVHWPMPISILGYWVNAENASWIGGYLLLVLASVWLRSRRIVWSFTAMLFLIGSALPVVAFISRGILLNSPSMPLLLVLIIPLVFGLRRWSARQSL